MALKIDVLKREQGVFVIAVGGSLDSNTYSDLEKRLEPLRKTSTKGLVLDLKELDYISSMGVGVLLKTKRWAADHGAGFFMVNVPPQINEVFRIIKALPDVPIFATLEEADRYFAEIQKKIKDEQGEGSSEL